MEGGGLSVAYAHGDDIDSEEMVFDVKSTNSMYSAKRGHKPAHDADLRLSRYLNQNRTVGDVLEAPSMLSE